MYIQLLEAVNLCLIVGLAVDYVVHFAEGYHMSSYTTRLDRIQDTLQRVGISVLSGAITTLGASFFLMFARIVFFFQFGVFVFCTIGSSMVFSLFVFMAAYSIMGPQGYNGSFLKCCKDKDKKTKDKSQDGDRDVEKPNGHVISDIDKGKSHDNHMMPTNQSHGSHVTPQSQSHDFDDGYDNPAMDGTEMYF